MKKNNSTREQTTGTSHNHIPDIDIIDLELDGNPEDELSAAEEFPEQSRQTPADHNDTSRRAADLKSSPYVGEDVPPLTDTPDKNEDFPDREQNEAAELFPNTGVEESEENDILQDEEPDEERGKNPSPRKKLPPFVNGHVLLLAVFVIFIVSIVIKFRNWGQFIDPSEIENEKTGEYLDVLDQILPLTDSEGRHLTQENVDTIVAFGNGPFADDRGSKNNLANLIQEASGVKVYNCSVSGSYLASQQPAFDSNKAPMDAYCFYWLVTLAASGANSHYYQEAAAVLGDALPPEAQEVYDTLTTLDWNTVDVVTVMYDATDYLLGHDMYDDANSTNITQFTGNLEAGIELLKATYPHIRIIVMSPTYAFAIDENGDYVSSDMYTYGKQDVLSTYVIKEYGSCSARGVTFIDHLYGTVTEDNAKECLTDNLHLNLTGRNLVAKRFLSALNFYNKQE